MLSYNPPITGWIYSHYGAIHIGEPLGISDQLAKGSWIPLVQSTGEPREPSHLTSQITVDSFERVRVFLVAGTAIHHFFYAVRVQYTPPTSNRDEHACTGTRPVLSSSVEPLVAMLD
jgi:hypothetical protein